MNRSALVDGEVVDSGRARLPRAPRPDSSGIVADGLSKRYGKNVALDDVSFTVRAGTIHALLGPNGAGKTTAVRILATLTLPDAGTARICGLDVSADAAAVKRMIGLTGQFAAVDNELSGYENLVLIGRLLKKRRPAARARALELLDEFGLLESRGRLVRTYSGGMRRRLDLAASLVGNPQVLYLDEPTTGLDPGSRVVLWRAVRRLVDSGTSVLLTTQYLDEADQFADEITILRAGRVIAGGASESLKSRIGGRVLEVKLTNFADLERALSVIRMSTGGTVDVDLPSAIIRTEVKSGCDPSHVFRHLDEAGVQLSLFTLRLPTLDEVYFALTQDPAPC